MANSRQIIFALAFVNYVGYKTNFFKAKLAAASFILLNDKVVVTLENEMRRRNQSLRQWYLQRCLGCSLQYTSAPFVARLFKKNE